MNRQNCTRFHIQSDKNMCMALFFCERQVISMHRKETKKFTSFKEQNMIQISMEAKKQRVHACLHIRRATHKSFRFFLLLLVFISVELFFLTTIITLCTVVSFFCIQKDFVFLYPMSDCYKNVLIIEPNKLHWMHRIFYLTKSLYAGTHANVLNVIQSVPNYK